jgi:hypothetical protein
VIVDVVMDRGDSTSQKWATDRASTPLMKFEAHETRLEWHPAKRDDWTQVGQWVMAEVIADDWTQVGQWVVAEKDRAVFVIPKALIVGKNLRLCPRVNVDHATRYPVVHGKWIRKDDDRAWSFWLRIDKTGAIQKSEWVNREAQPPDTTTQSRRWRTT